MDQERGGPGGRGAVLITGGARRLGLAIAEGLAASGYDLALHVRRCDEEAQAAAQRLSALGAKVSLHPADLDDPADVAALAGPVAAAHDRLVGLVNNASLFRLDDLATLEAEVFLAHQRVNVLAPLLLIQALAPRLGASGGSVVNILDHNIENPNIDFLSYKLSKFALAGATRVLARRLAPKVRVNAVAPGLTLPSPLQSPEDFQAIHDAVPLGAGSEPDDIAKAARYLIEAPAVTGQILFVDGGERFLGRLRDVSILADPEAASD